MTLPMPTAIQNPKSKIHCLVGPTGVGKTALALALAERLDAEIIGADAFQIYAGLPLLTAQPAAADLARVPHHLIGEIPPAESFDAPRYAAAARAALAAIAARGKTALVVGGTGLYLRALFEGFAPTPPPDPTLRAALESLPLPALLDRLERADPAAPALVDRQNPRRVLRAIEIVESTGQPLAAFRATPRAPWPPGVLLVRDREDLRRRIAANVDAMFAAGVIDEVRALLPHAGLTAAQAIGFREISAHLRGELTRDEARDAILTATRQYAKRQLTWFRRQTTLPSLDLTDSPHPSMAAESALRALVPS